MDKLNELDRNMPILVVDDLPAMRRIIKNCLRQLGFENVSEAADGPEAFAQLNQGSFKFVISDWQMPGADGAVMINSLRDSCRRHGIPVLLVTAPTQRDMLQKMVADGDLEIVVKPFTAEVLQVKIAEAFAKPAPGAPAR
jgi:two-component system chemotaxis response regulator CheY